MAAILMLCLAGLTSTASAAPAAGPRAESKGGPKAGPKARTGVPKPGSAPLYVSDYTANDVLKRSPDGSQTTVPTDGLTRPTYMVLDPAGNLYISDTVNSRVVKVPADGGPQETVPTTDLLRPLGLALDAAGNLYIADSFNDRVVKVPADGGPQETVPTSGLLHPSGLALDAGGDLYIADFVNDRVVKVPVGGGPQTTVPTSGLSQPTGLALDRPSNGDLYIADSGNDRVVKVPTVGGPQTTVPTNGLKSPQDLAFDPARNLYIADFGNDRVVKIRADGGSQTTVPFTGLTTPAGVATPPAPTPPTEVTATAGSGKATVSFTPSTSVSVVTYTVTAKNLTNPSRGGQTAQGTGSPVTVKGLTPGDEYTFTVTATNAAGATSVSSDPSGAVTIPDGERVRTSLKAKPATVQWHFRPPTLKVRGLSATLTKPGGTPVADQTVRFSNVSKTRQLCRAVTDSRGVARCDATVRDRLQKINRLYEDLRRSGYRATYSGSTVYRPSTDTAPVRSVR